ncbi:MAG: CBS domain-containing protein, partial [Elusimicrobia bacterium]|nr:CBS domain-containing protein [Elusimicrobiota bacterium]MBD3411719.1 CBS domain-containing protein [Elusimicrobiota bacterium]
IDASWIIIAVLVLFSLSRGVFPYYYKDLSASTYWLMGFSGTVLLFFSVIFHEMFHSLVARRFGMPMKGITLFIFGGIAEMDDEPPSAKAEFFMSAVGPLSSIVLGLILYGVYTIGKNAVWPTPVIGVLAYMSFLNFILAGFNLVPAFPLDGGRIFRSILWSIKKNVRWATRIASDIGGAFAIILIILGVMGIFSGNIFGGFWWVLIGLFLKSASHMSYQRLLIRRTLEGEPVNRFMKTDVVSVSPDLSLKELVDDYVYRYHHKMYPVIDNGTLRGCITTRDIKNIPRSEWSDRTISDRLSSCSSANTIDQSTDAVTALSVMKKSGTSRLLVTDQDRLVGIVSLKDLLDFLSVKLDLEGEEDVSIDKERI